MSDSEEPVVLTICGQELRLRLSREGAENAKTVAKAVDDMIRERKKGAMPSDLKASVMTAFELAFELQEAHEEIERLRAVNAAGKMDRLLERIDQEMKAGESAKQ